jgi:hypothetical protein
MSDAKQPTASELKRQREREERMALFAQSDARPANTDLSTILGTEEGAQPVAQPPDPPAVQPQTEVGPEKAAQAPAAPADDPTPAPTAARPAKAAKTAPPPKKKAEPEPWREFVPDKAKGFTTTFDPELHARLVWITETVPKMSIQKIVKAAVLEYAEKLIAEHTKP